jgi:hypothetical protein
LPKPRSPVARLEAAELNQACHVRVQLQAESPEPLAEIGEELLGIPEVLEPGHEMSGRGNCTPRLPQNLT